MGVDRALEKLLPRVRAALEADRALSGRDDAMLATAVNEAFPRLRARLREQHDDARAQIERDFPWALSALDWDADLLGGLGKERSEVSHTRFLAYLLDSRASHGLGIRPLRELFRLLARLIPGDHTFARLSGDADDAAERLRRVRVIAEHAVEAPAASGAGVEERRCDIWLELVEEGHALVVVIENKVDAGEHDEQLASYEQAVWKWAKDHRRNSFEQRLVFLTPEGRMPDGGDDHAAWLPISYTELAAALAHAARDAAEPGRTLVLLYVSTVAKWILEIPAQLDEVNFARRLAWMHEVIEQGAHRE